MTHVPSRGAMADYDEGSETPRSKQRECDRLLAILCGVQHDLRSPVFIPTLHGRAILLQSSQFGCVIC